MVLDNGLYPVVAPYVTVQRLADELFHILNIDHHVFLQRCTRFSGLTTKFNIKHDGSTQITKRNGLQFGIFSRHGNWIIKNYVYMYQVLPKEINKRNKCSIVRFFFQDNIRSINMRVFFQNLKQMFLHWQMCL